jgi:hypothetical protein
MAFFRVGIALSVWSFVLRGARTRRVQHGECAVAREDKWLRMKSSVDELVDAG